MPNSKKLLAGASGYSFKEWKGSFYPEKLPQKQMLSYYAERFAAVGLAPEVLLSAPGRGTELRFRLPRVGLELAGI